MIKRKSIVYSIPGGWYGNDPGSCEHDRRYGIVAVDPRKIVQAITWLKRRATIIDSFIGSTGKEINLAYIIKQREENQC